MRQLGVGLPEPPPVETDAEKSSETPLHEQISLEERELVEVYRLEPKRIQPEPAERLQETVTADADPGPVPDSVPLPHERFAVEARTPVEVHRIERNPTEPEPVAPRQEEAVETRSEPLPKPESSLPDPAPVANPRHLEEERSFAPAPIGRWEEFHDRRDEPERDDRIHLAPMPARPGPSSTLLTADLEREHRSPFLILAVLGIAALLAVGAVLWSGSLRYRVRQQNAAMSALQEQNQKMAETLAQKGEGQKSVEQTGENQAAENPAAKAQKTTSAPDSEPDVPRSPATPSQPAITPAKTRQLANRQGVAAPPPLHQEVGQHRRSSGAERPPEIVPPYPTLFKSGNVAANASNSQPVPSAGAYQPPFTPRASQPPAPVTRSDRPVTNTSTVQRASAPQASPASRLPTPTPANNNAPAATPDSASQYTPTGNGEYVSPLAQNIEAVEGLQRHSPVQLREFHARAGASTQATPNVRLSVQPDQGRGSYALVVSSGGANYQLRGEVNQPLVFTDTATHREYALVILSIAGQQAYGYVRANVKQ